MVVKDVIDFLDNYAPLEYAEDFDNVGLLTGDLKEKVTGILICLDSTKEVIQEAIDLNYNLVISFHPIIFNGLKKLHPGNYVNDSIVLAIKNNISIFPNPTDNKIKIKMKNMNPDNYNLSILNIYGDIIKNKNIKVKRDYFDSFELDKFSKGIYILKIESNYYSTFKKIILE